MSRVPCGLAAHHCILKKSLRTWNAAQWHWQFHSVQCIPFYFVFFFLYSVPHLEQEAHLQPQEHHEFPRETNHLASSEGFEYFPFFLRVPDGSRTWFPISLEIWLVGRPSPISLRGRRRGQWWIDLLWPAFPLHRCLSFLLCSTANAAGTQGHDVTIWQSARGGWCRV